MPKTNLKIVLGGSQRCYCKINQALNYAYQNKNYKIKIKLISNWINCIDQKIDTRWVPTHWKTPIILYPMCRGNFTYNLSHQILKKGKNQPTLVMINVVHVLKTWHTPSIF